MKRVDLIPLIKEKGISSKNLTNVIVEEVLRFEALNRDNVDVKVLSQTVSTFLNKVKEKLSKYNRMYERFLISRINVMTNQFHHLLIRTDPVISSISFRKHKNINGKPIPEDVLGLLK